MIRSGERIPFANRYSGQFSLQFAYFVFLLR